MPSNIEKENPSQVVIGKQDNYEIAYREAVQILSESDIEDRCKKSGAKINGTNPLSVLLPFLNEKIIITHPEISITYPNKNDDPPLWLKIIILHYLIFSKGTPATGNDITFKQLEGGLSYFPVFQKRAITPLINVYGNNLENFVKIGEMLGGIRSSYGDYALTFRVFPKINIVFLFWKGDDEFPIEGNVIFDSSISDYLSTEDIAVLCNMIAVMIIKKAAS